MFQCTFHSSYSVNLKYNRKQNHGNSKPHGTEKSDVTSTLTSVDDFRFDFCIRKQVRKHNRMCISVWKIAFRVLICKLGEFGLETEEFQLRTH